MNLSGVKNLCSISRASCIALLLFLSAPELLFAAPSTRIFVLHSYSQEYLWTNGQHEGFIQALSEDAPVDADISTEYMDTKRLDYNGDYAIELTRHLLMKYKGYKPAAIYVTDDNALLFARDYLSRVFPGVAVFFSGINDYGVQSSLDTALFTGVFERKEVGPNIELLLHIDKGANDLVFIGDGSNTYQAIYTEARNDLIPYHLRATFIAEKRLDRALERLHTLPGKYVFLTTLGGMTDEHGQVLPLRDILKSLASTGRIIISMEDSYIIEGVLGGHVTSGQKQGQSAARLLLAYLHGKPIVDLPPLLKSPNALILDDGILKKYGIDLPESLRAGVVLVNPRPAPYEEHRSLILGSLKGLAALLFLVVTVSLVVMKHKNRALELARNSAESVNSLFNQLAEQSRTVHWKTNAEGLYTYVSPVSYAVLGYRPEELVGQKHFYDLFSEDESDTDKTAAFKFFTQKKPFHNLENTARTKDGRLIWILTNALPVPDDHGTFMGYRGSDSDISERKKAEQALESSLSLLSASLESTADGIMIVDREGMISRWNKKFADMWKLPEEVLSSRDDGKTINYILAQLADPEQFVANVRNLYEQPEKSSFDQIDFLDGRVFERYSQPQRIDNTIAGRVWSFRDITDRKRAEAEKRSLEERLQRAEKMEALGQLAGGVAHDLNNVLGVLSGYSELLLMEIPQGQRGRGHVEKILKSTEKGATIIQDLLTLARRGVTATEVVNLNAVIEGFLKTPVLENIKDYHPRVAFRADYDPNLLNIRGSSLHLEKTVMNLVSNAAESISGIGEVTIQTENRYLDKAVKGYDEVEEGDYVVLTVSDTGMGIPAESLEKIFEPFYTKKKMGRSGTGLGLAIVWGTVKDHKGYIDVQSHANEGTTFTLFFPVTRDELTAPQQTEPLESYRGNGEAILVVDDITEQREIAAGLLAKLGYHVQAVASGEEAVEYLRRNSADILVLDMIMAPGIDGLETWQRVLEVNPRQKAIIVSGFSETDRAKEAQRLGAGAYVKKPYLLEKIGVAIRDELKRQYVAK